MNSIESIKILAEKPVKWLGGDDSEESIALSSRIRLARNILGFKFPANSSNIEKEHINELIFSTVGNSNIIQRKLNFKMSELSNVDRRFLLERHLVSKDFCAGNVGSELILESDESFGIMVNEEDHVRMQVLSAGFSLVELWKKINAKDSAISKEVSFAFDSELGYLTSCPTNVGTGMRASVMLNLPGLSISGHMPGVIQGSEKLGMTVRGLYGEGSEAIGYIYQVSNQSTLGEAEEEIIERLEKLIRQIVLFEKNARQILFQTRRSFVLDFVGKAYGALRYSHLISEKEALIFLSALRMGVDMKMFSSLSIGKVNELFISVQDSHLQKIYGRELTASEREMFRAELLREKLNNN